MQNKPSTDDRQPSSVARQTDPSGAHRTTSPNLGEEWLKNHPTSVSSANYPSPKLGEGAEGG